jgi:DNA-binding transcriptional ArsR family regulator
VETDEKGGDVVVEEHIPTAEELDLGKVLNALADPHRRRVIRELLEEPEGAERTCASFALPVSKSSNTFHFRVLREAGLTYDTSYGNRRGVSLRRLDIDSRFPGLLDAISNAPEPEKVRQS